MDLAAVPPDGVVESDGIVLGQLDESAFFPRAAACAAALDVLVAEGTLAPESEERFPVIIRYPSGADAVEDVAERSYGRMPEALAVRVRDIEGPVEIREFSSVRSFTLEPDVDQK